MPWDKDLPQGYEAQKIKYEIVKYTRGLGLDLGCGPQKPYAHFIGIDLIRHNAAAPDIVCGVEDLSIFTDESMDFAFSSHCLEHLEDTEAVLREWFRVIKPGGYLVLYLPHKAYYPNMGEPNAKRITSTTFCPKTSRR